MLKETIKLHTNLETILTGYLRRDVLKMLGAGIGIWLTAAALSTSAIAETQQEIIGHTLFGSGSTHAIVLHDWSVSTESGYSAVKQYFDPSKVTFAFADVRGYGKSKEMKGEFSHREISDDVAKLADSLGWDKFSLIGHSMTGMSVQRIMADMPERLNRVIATTPVPATGFPLDDESFAFFESMATDDTAFENGMHALTSTRYGKGWANYKLMQNRASVSTEAMKEYTAMWSRDNFVDDVKGNETPLLIIYGEFDTEGLRQTATGELFRSWYPNLSEHVCPSGHYPMLESPVDYASAVQKYLLAEL